MAEHLRLLGDLTEPSSPARWPRSSTSCNEQAEPSRSSSPGRREPRRWIAAEDQAALSNGLPGGMHASWAWVRPTVRPMPRGRGHATLGSRRSPRRDRRAFLRTHALIGLADLTARYPIDPAEATDLLERWAEAGKAVRLGEPGDPDDDRWADRQNLAEMRRVDRGGAPAGEPGRRPEVFADFVLRRQHVHPATRGEGPAFVEAVLEQLQGFAMPARQLGGRRPAASGDRTTARPGWTTSWRAARGSGGRRDRRGASRGSPSSRGTSRACRPPADEPGELGADELRILDLLGRQGASFATELARASGLEPSRVRRALIELAGARAGDQRPLRPDAAPGPTRRSRPWPRPPAAAPRGRSLGSGRGARSPARPRAAGRD